MLGQVSSLFRQVRMGWGFFSELRGQKNLIKFKVWVFFNERPEKSNFFSLFFFFNLFLGLKSSGLKDEKRKKLEYNI